jgi:hypothetical protein
LIPLSLQWIYAIFKSTTGKVFYYMSGGINLADAIDQSLHILTICFPSLDQINQESHTVIVSHVKRNLHGFRQQRNEELDTLLV